MRCLQTIVDDEDDEGLHVHWSKVKATYGRVAVCLGSITLSNELSRDSGKFGCMSADLTQVWGMEKSMEKSAVRGRWK